jgi:hypothetical protein
MSKPRKVRATFSNGVVKDRSSLSKVYTHAYQFITGKGWQQFGFSTSEEQCRRNLAAESAYSAKHNGPLQFSEVVEVEVLA